MEKVRTIFLIVIFFVSGAFFYRSSENQSLKQKENKTPQQDTNYAFTETCCDVNIDFVFVKGGTFEMGSENGDSDEKPVHNVTVDDFYMSKYEITVGQFAKFVKSTGYKTEAEKRGWSWVLKDGKWKHANGVSWKADPQRDKSDGTSKEDFPVTHISWSDANEFCKWLSEKTHLTYRLATEAEWEYAAGGGQKSVFKNDTDSTSVIKLSKYSGTNSEKNLESYAWYQQNSKSKSHPVGKKKPNELGLYDMTGNVWEWCADWYKADYYDESPTINPKCTETGAYRVIKGGSWFEDAYGCRNSNRGRSLPDPTVSNIGFRIVCEPW